VRSSDSQRPSLRPSPGGKGRGAQLAWCYRDSRGEVAASRLRSSSRSAGWRTVAVWLAAATIAISGCSGYQIGYRSLYPADVRTVYVPVFESNSFRRNLGERLTEAVVKEIELKTPYKVVGDPNADSVLTGKIANDTKRALVIAPTDELREIEVNLMVTVRWIDRRGDVLRPAQSIPLPSSLADVSQAASLVPEVGQSVATAQQQAIDRMAEQIVALMESPW